MVVAFLGVGVWVLRGLPTEHELHFRAPAGQLLRSAELAIESTGGELLRQVRLDAPTTPSRIISYTCQLPRGTYQISGAFEICEGNVDKCHRGDWTRLGFRHQISVEGGALTIPLPDERTHDVTH